MSADQSAERARWVIPAVYSVLGVELAVVIAFAATYNALDFRIYMWGGQAVLHDTRLYLALASGHWFTYSPFAAVVFVPIAALPLAVARVLWDLASVAALAYSCVIIVKLAGYRPTKLMVAGLVAAAMALDPVYETLFLGQINLILLALILTDIWRVSRGREAGLGVGVGVGIAAAIKLTPAIFILFFLLARRTKAALVAAGTFVACGLIGFGIAPRASKLYWEHLFYDTKRVGAPYISNQSPYAAAIRIAEGAAHIGSWWPVIPVAFAVAGLATATILVRHQDWLGATAVTGTTGLLVSPISWAHHWVWILPALVWLVRRDHRIAAAAGYLLFALAPFWFTPHSGGPHEYGFHWLSTLVANCFLIAGLIFLGYLARHAYLLLRRPAVPDGVNGVDGVRAVEVPAGAEGRSSSAGPAMTRSERAAVRRSAGTPGSEPGSRTGSGVRARPRRTP